MKNAIEKASIAKDVANYIIDHLLIEDPMSADELESIAASIAEDRGIIDSEEFEDITRIAVNYVTNDPRVNVESKGKEGEWALWI